MAERHDDHRQPANAAVAADPKATPDLSLMSEQERHRYEHQKMHERHRGHETMHMEMMLVLVGTLVLAQLLLLYWKQKHFRSYQRATLLGMWLIPVITSIYLGWLRFVIIWCVFTAVTGYVYYLASRQPLPGTTPRWVYKWFLLIYKACYGAGVAGYALVLLTFFGLNLLLLIQPTTLMSLGVTLLFYGLYFGVVSRDFAEVCSERMAAQIGYYTQTGLPGRTLEKDMCAVCGNHIIVSDNEQALIERTYTLNCQHVFHEFCIRGWCIVGKKQTCPYCKERVDLKRMFANPWEKTHVYYATLLDGIRFLVAWQPVIVMAVQGINLALGLE